MKDMMQSLCSSWSHCRNMDDSTNIEVQKPRRHSDQETAREHKNHHQNTAECEVKYHRQNTVETDRTSRRASDCSMFSIRTSRRASDSSMFSMRSYFQKNQVDAGAADDGGEGADDAIERSASRALPTPIETAGDARPGGRSVRRRSSLTGRNINAVASKRKPSAPRRILQRMRRLTSSRRQQITSALSSRHRRPSAASTITVTVAAAHEHEEPSAPLSSFSRPRQRQLGDNGRSCSAVTSPAAEKTAAPSSVAILKTIVFSTSIEEEDEDKLNQEQERSSSRTISNILNEDEDEHDDDVAHRETSSQDIQVPAAASSTIDEDKRNHTDETGGTTAAMTPEQMYQYHLENYLDDCCHEYHEGENSLLLMDQQKNKEDVAFFATLRSSGSSSHYHGNEVNDNVVVGTTEKEKMHMSLQTLLESLDDINYTHCNDLGEFADGNDDGDYNGEGGGVIILDLDSSSCCDSVSSGVTLPRAMT